MKITRETITTVMIDETNKLTEGDTCKFIANNACYFGEFMGVSKRGCLTFASTVGKLTEVFSIMPSSIKALQVIEHAV